MSTQQRNGNVGTYGHSLFLWVLGALVYLGALPAAEAADPQDAFTVAPTASLPYRRAGHTATALPDGRILIVGGDMDGLGGRGNPNDALVWDPTTRQYTSAGQMPDGARYHHQIAVHGGKVWVFGGTKATLTAGQRGIATVECWDPALNGGQGGFITKTPLAHARTSFLLVQNGSLVYVIGGHDSTSQPIGSIEEYDLAANGGGGVTRVAGTLLHPRFGMAGNMLSNGKILVMGGFTGLYIKDFTQRVASLTDSSEWFDPATGESSEGPKIPPENGFGAQGFLVGSRILLMPSFRKTGATTYATTGCCQWFDPAADGGKGAFSVGPRTNIPRVSAGGIGQLLDGSIVIAGGFSCSFDTSDVPSTFLSSMLDSVEVLRPMDDSGNIGEWKLLATKLSEGKDYFSSAAVATSLTTGEFLVAGGMTVIGGDTYTTTADVLAPVPGGLFIRGDSNADGATDISDAIGILSFLFTGSKALPCQKAADITDDGTVDISDGVALLSHLFLGGKAPPEPFAACGVDPTEDELTCQSFAPCM